MAEERSFESPPIPIETARLRKSYGARLAADDLTFSVNAGEVVGLLGPNGAGYLLGKGATNGGPFGVINHSPCVFREQFQQSQLPDFFVNRALRA